MLDFDPEVVAFSSQPFWLSWPEAGGRAGMPRTTSPGCATAAGWWSMSALMTGSRAKDAENVRGDGRCVRSVGWAYRRVGHGGCGAGRQRALAGGLPPSPMPHRGRAARLREVFAGSGSADGGARAAGDPVAVLPVLYHLLWRELVADLAPARWRGIGGQCRRRCGDRVAPAGAGGW